MSTEYRLPSRCDNPCAHCAEEGLLLGTAYWRSGPCWMPAVPNWDKLAMLHGYVLDEVNVEQDSFEWIREMQARSLDGSALRRAEGGQ